MKKIDERQLQKTTKEQKVMTERSKGNRSYSKRVRAKWFCGVFKLGFLQLICKASLIFKSNLELAWSINLKLRELYESKHIALECRCLQIWDLLSFLINSLILVLKWRQVSPIQLELQLAQVNLCTRKDFKSLENGSLYKKIIFNFEWTKNQLNVKIFLIKLFAKFRKFIFDMLWKVPNIW